MRRAFAWLGQMLAKTGASRPPRSVGLETDDESVKVVFDNGEAVTAFHWANVAEIRAFKRDCGTFDDIRLAFRAGETWSEFSEDLEGFERLSQAMKDRFPAIPGDWFETVMQPPFATNETVLYQRS